MDETHDARWKQRLSNLNRALFLLRDALKDGTEKLSLLEKEGTVQRFEYSLELAWKATKDYLEAKGSIIAPVTPKQVLKDAVDARILDDGQVWIDMLNHRNLLSHTYDSSTFDDAVQAIAERYLPAMEKLREFLTSESQE